MWKKTVAGVMVLVLVASAIGIVYGESVSAENPKNAAGYISRPTDGAVLSATVPQNVEWYVFDPDVILMFYVCNVSSSIDNGVTWKQEGTVPYVFLWGSYQWTPPLQDVTNTTRIKVTCWTDPELDGVPNDYACELLSGPFSLDATPPSVVSTVPGNGEKNVDPSTTITITFSEPMNTSSAQTAFSLRNASGGIIDGTFSWSGDTIMTFYPNATLMEENMTYTCYILSTAKDKSDPGNPMQSDYMFTFKTIEPLQNVSIYAPTKTTVWTGGYNQTISYEIIGGKRDFNLTYYYSPDNGTTWYEIGNKTNSSSYVDTYTWSVPYLNSTQVKVAISVTDAKGNTTYNVSEPFTVDSTKPYIVEFSPQNNSYTVAPNATIKIVFSEPMNTQSVESAFSLEANYVQVSGTFTWENNNTTMLFTPNTPLAYQTTYYVNITPLARDISQPGNTLDMFQAQFTTIPNIILTLTSPGGGEIWTGGSTKSVSWNIQNGYAPYNISVYASTNSGATYPTLVGTTTQNTPGNANISFTVPYLNISAYRLQIRAVDAKGFTAYGNMSADITIDSGAPTVTACNIQNNTLVSISTWINVTFSEKMDENSVQQAFTLESDGTKVTGTFTWANNTLTFRPTAKLQYGKTYYLNITSEAKDISNPGNHLISFLRVFRTAPPHNLTLIAPNETIVYTGGYSINITWNFSGGEAPWILEIAMSRNNGSTYPEIVWNHTISEGIESYLWEIPKIDADAVKLRVRVTDAQGFSSTVYSQKFGIDATKPVVESILPQPDATNISIDTNQVVLTFSEPLINSTLEKALSLTAVSLVNGAVHTPNATFAWNENFTKLTLSFSITPLYLSHRYYVNISNGVKDLSFPGNEMDVYSAHFDTQPTDDINPPEVSGHYPKKGSYGIPVKIPIIINFTKAMNRHDTEFGISFTPTLTGRVEWKENDTQFYFIPDQMKPSTTYTVKVSKDACDKAKIALRSEYSFTFSTAASIDYGAVFGWVMEANETNFTKPLLNATINVYRGEMLVLSNIHTDADGFFYINLQEGRYVLEVTKEGYNTTKVNVTVVAGYETDAGVIGISVLPPGPEFPWWILLLIVLIVVVVLLAFWYMRKRTAKKSRVEAEPRQAQTEVQKPVVQPPPAQTMETKTPAPETKPKEQKEKTAVCAICLKELVSGELVYKCSCGTMSHAKCINAEGKCPMCGKPVGQEQKSF